MDLYRVVTASGNIDKELPKQSVIEFMKHADKDFEKTKLTKREQMLREQLKNLLNKLPNIKNSNSRLKWAEDILTIRCRL